MKQSRYNNLCALRALASVCILAMHVYIVGEFRIGGDQAAALFEHINFKISDLVRIFFILSGFSMCCGYYERIRNGGITPDSFYTKRYVRILPFFALIVAADLGATVLLGDGLSTDKIAQAIANLSLIFGFMPVKGMFDVIGIGWTLGVIFGFYLLFPFFVWMLWTKRRAWLMLIAALVIGYLYERVFLIEGEAVKANVFRWFSYFMAGGIIYLYRVDIVDFVTRHRRLSWVSMLLGLLLVFGIPEMARSAAGVIIDHGTYLIGGSLLLCGCLGADAKVLFNPITKWLSDISMEVYLCHLLVFRVVELFGLVHLVQNEAISYLVAFALTLAGAAAFATVYRMVERWILTRMQRKGNEYGTDHR